MIYAKSNPIESLGEHTEKLMQNYEELRKSYGDKLGQDKLLELLEVAVKYHDAGKIYSQFQNRIIENINKYQDEEIKKVPSCFDKNVRHNYLSPSFLPLLDLDYKTRILKVLIQAIAYHHERNKEINKSLIKEIIKKELQKKRDKIEEELGVETPEELGRGYTKFIGQQQRIKCNHENYHLYVLLKGLLHKLDHSASAHEKVELDVGENIGEYTQYYFEENGWEKRGVQNFSYANKDKNLIVVASTGMGKTESALLWIDSDKSFFTLPLRVSINALYDRVAKEDDGMGYKYVGLLHSTSIDYLEESDYDQGEEIYSQSKLLSKKLTFCTIDQILKFPFRYRGYEKSYATMAYSKVVIDEIQAYDPEISAVLLKALEMIDEIGGKFMIMTATLPKIYTNFLEERDIIVDDKAAYGEFLNDTIRHKIKVKETAISDDVDEIIERGRAKKVLVIVNTVDRAIDIFDGLNQNSNGINLNLLHSMFIKKDRALLEKRVKNFADSEGETGIWVTTQLVEASLDIDFDYLFTELSSLDSLFQRLGRCYRKREFDLDEPNVYIYTEEVKGVGTIYDKDVWNSSKKKITNYNLEKLTEEDKVKMVEELYSRENLEGSKYLEDFDNALDYLDKKEPYQETSNQAQSLLRNINNINVIPRDIYDDISDKIHRYKEYQVKTKEDKKAFKGLRREISKHTASIPHYKAKDDRVSPISDEGRLSDIYILNRRYDFDEERLMGKGVLIDEELGCIIG